MEDLLNETKLFYNEAYSSKKEFSRLMHQAWKRLQDQIWTFYSALR